ncbi:PEP/pyruvate-binding domain-containing protein [Streptomyces sp. A30]|uniref:PEP/pyruvate-binding domain-containing protein n=1 Tax=Streptomyces sp. A30 TaxID=2789273 RepID=UPI00398190DD
MTTLDERHGEGARDGEEVRGRSVFGLVGAVVPAAVPLDRPSAALPWLTGSKAANLARAARAGLPVLPGFVIPPRGGGDTVALRRAWHELSEGGARPLVVRSSSPQEDTEESSLAGQFASVLDVRDWPDFRTAVQTVLDSARRSDGSTAPMAVLVQPMLSARVGGVLFGADPVEGRADRMLVSGVRGGPDSLVSGEQGGANYWLSRRGRILRTERPETDGSPPQPHPAGTDGTPPSRFGLADTEPLVVRSDVSETDAPLPRSAPPETDSPPTRSAPQGTDSPPTHPTPQFTDSPLTRSELFRLARLARRARRVFGGPQDIEFGFDEDGRLWLFQSRPITAMAARPARRARLLGPGPVAETLPGQLLPLEEDLWVAPMSRGLATALDIGGTAPRRLLRTVPVVTTVDGRAAADLRLLGTATPRHRWLALLNPAPGARRLGAAWRMGRLTAALPGLATDLIADVDRRLTEIPSPATLSGHDLAAELRWTRRVLVSLHAQETLAGALLSEPPRSRTAAGTALTALAEARAQGVPDDRVVAADPVVLALTAPSLRGPERLPQPVVPSQEDAATGRRKTAPPPAQVAADPIRVTTLTHERSTATTPDHPSPRTTAALTLALPLTERSDPRRSPNAASASATTAALQPREALPPREALRLRIRWVQELQVRLVRETARRMGRGMERVGLLSWRELIVVLEGGPLPGDLHARVPQPQSPPLPDTFRLAEGGVVIAERDRRRGDGVRGVSGGRAAGTVWDGTGTPPSGAVLVVRTLDPALAPLLPGLTALVAQTGSPLSHLAVLAREFGLPAVVGATDAVRRFPPGSRLAVDGTTGDVELGEAP